MILCKTKLFKTIILLVTIFFASFPASSQANQSTKPKIEDLILEARQHIKKCSDAYLEYKANTFAANMAFEAELDANHASARLRGEPEERAEFKEPEPVHKYCAEKAKKEFIPAAKLMIKSTSGSVQKSTKDMVAQWITAIDSIGNKAEDSEIAKFETIANGLLLDL